MPSVLRNIERAAKAWREGDDCLAYIHLAHTGLSRPQDLQSAAYRLEMAQFAIKYGASSRTVFKAPHLDARYIEAIEKAYNPAESRVPAGSGKTSGETSDDAATVGAEGAGDGTGGDGAHASSLLGSLALPAIRKLEAKWQEKHDALDIVFGILGGHWNRLAGFDCEDVHAPADHTNIVGYLATATSRKLPAENVIQSVEPSGDLRISLTHEGNAYAFTFEDCGSPV